ncbi:MAG: HD domain-containing protein [Candidatus Omnitrophica bacterium]|nr:HD domain-containing protein [Candidatus Omnitrophota bacterium]
MLHKSIPEFSNSIYYLEQHEKHKDFPVWVIRHQKEVFLLSYQMGEMLGFEDERLTDLAIAARFHDIGKTHIDPEIINHEGALNDAQRYAVFEHVHQSYDILKKKGVDSKAILDGVFYHHENYDGTGYPDKLKADEIPLEAQILRIVDSFSAMLGRRPYHNRSKKDFKWALLQIEENSGSLYNPKLVDVFLAITGKAQSKPDEDSTFNRLHNILLAG